MCSSHGLVSSIPRNRLTSLARGVPLLFCVSILGSVHRPQYCTAEFLVHYHFHMPKASAIFVNLHCCFPFDPFSAILQIRDHIYVLSFFVISRHARSVACFSSFSADCFCEIRAPQPTPTPAFLSGPRIFSNDTTCVKLSSSLQSFHSLVIELRCRSATLL